MANALLIVLVLILVGLAIEDFKERKVRLALIILLFIVSLTVFYFRLGVIILLANILTNICLILFLSLFIVVWLVLIKKAKPSDYNRYFGKGDILFLLAITPISDLQTYLGLLVLSLVLSLVWWLVYFRNKDIAIPFIGTSSLIYSTYFILLML